jgi:AraC family transcriptional regulator
VHHLEQENRTFIYRVLEYIHCNLSGDLGLETLASVASYSPFHFQRLFSTAIGESPRQYVIRLRLEKSAHHLILFPDLSITEIALDSGFSSLSAFSRAFNAHFGISPKAYKNLSPDEFRKICKTDSKKSKINTTFSYEFWRVNFSQADMTELESKLEINVKTVRGMQLYFLQTCLDTPDAITVAFRKLCSWAEPRGLITSETRFVGILLDIPLITPLEKCRYRACITAGSIPAGKKEPGSMNIEPGSFASFELKGDLYSAVKGLVYLNHHWLPGSGYAIREMMELEVFSENPAGKPVEQIRREILLPVRPARLT